MRSTAGLITFLICCILSARAVAEPFVDALRSADPARVEAALPVETSWIGAPRVTDVLGELPRPRFARDYVNNLRVLRAAIPNLKIDVQEEVLSSSTRLLRLSFTGIFSQALGTYPPTYGPIMFSATDLVRSDGDKITTIESTSDHVALLRGLTLAIPVRAPESLLPWENVLSVPQGTFIESLAAEPNGGFVMAIIYAGVIERLTPRGKRVPIAQLPDHEMGFPGFICLVRAEDGTLYVTYQRRADSGVWRVSPQGKGDLFARLPDGARPNGISFDGKGGLILGDNRGGLWRVNLASRKASRWIEHELLSPRPMIGLFPAANGVQRRGSEILVANSDRGHFVSVQINADGSAGAVNRIADQVPGDDFGLDAAGNAYVTTHPFNSIIKVTPQGERTIVGTPMNGILGPAAAIVVERRDGQWLYVANDGGLFGGLPVSEQKPGIVRLRLN
jgi:predicted ester cyclase